MKFESAAFTTSCEMANIVRSSYDSELSLLYKQAAKLGIPYRYLLFYQNGELEVASTSIPDDVEKLEYISLFQFIRSSLGKPIYDIWNSLARVRVGVYTHFDLINAWLLAFPEYRIENSTVLAYINDFLASIGEPGRYNNMTEVLTAFDAWKSQYDRELEHDGAILERYVASQNTISGIEPIAHSPLEIETMIVTFDVPVEEGINPIPDLFNNARVSYIVPFIQYNMTTTDGNRQQYYNIYKGETMDSHPNYSNISLTQTQAHKDNSLYLNVWIGDPDDEDESPEDGKKDSFSMASISYIKDKSVIRITYSSPNTENVDENAVLQRIKDHIPGLKVDKVDGSEMKISGTFTLYNIDATENVIYYLITNDPMFSSFLYLEESGKSFADKTRFNVHYRSTSSSVYGERKSSTTANLSQSFMIAGSYLKVQNPDGTVTENLQISSQIPVIEVKIIRSKSVAVAQRFIDILARLFRQYTESVQIYNMYNYYIPGFDEHVRTKKLEQESVYRNGERIKESQLRNAAPDVFVANFPRKCQTLRSPLPIRADEVDKWRHTKIDAETFRPVISFPPGNPKYFFTCPGDRYPHIGMIGNKSLSNRNIYPYLPCCFANDTRVSKTSNLNKYYGATTVTVGTVRKGYKILTDKVLQPEQRGAVPSSVSTLLKLYNPELTEVNRHGVPVNSNSFLHCVLIALGYADTGIEEFRRTLAQRVNPEALSQELYDYDKDKIIADMSNSEVFFDPLLFYRAVELVFNVNIYVFGLTDKDRNTNRATSLLLTPRHRLFYSKNANADNRVILIARHWGLESDALEYPHCELITAVNGRETIFVFDSSLNKLIYPAFKYVNRTLTWHISNRITCRLDLYSSLDYQEIFKGLYVTGQMIDQFGKMRMLAIAPRWKDESRSNIDPLRIFVAVNPSTPLNVPSFQLDQVEHHVPSSGSIKEMFGEPTAVTTNADGKLVTGLWFRVGDLPRGIYCPCVAYDNDATMEVDNEEILIDIPRPSLNRVDQVQRIADLKRAVSYINQIMKYLYLLADRPQPLEFLPRICVLNSDKNVDSAKLYNTRCLPRVLPTGTMSEVLAKLSDICPQIFNKGRLVVFDDKMYNGLYFELRRFYREIAGLIIPPTGYRELKDFYSSKSDFMVDRRRAFVLGSQAEYRLWSDRYIPSPNLQQRAIQNLNLETQTALNPDAYIYQEPYIFQNEQQGVGVSKMFIIQNVVMSDFSRAIQVAYDWHVLKKNNGFSTEPWKGSNYPHHIVYGINVNGTISPVQDYSEKDKVYLSILRYSERAYAAMLPVT